MGLTEDRKKLEERSIRMIKRLEVPAAKINKIKTLAASGAYSSSADWNKALIQINAAYNDMNIIFSEYAVAAIPQSYLIKAKYEIKKMKKIALDVIKNKIPKIVLESQYHKGAIKVLTDDTLLIFSSALDDGRKMTTGLLRRTQQAIITEQKLNAEIAVALSTNGTIQETKNRILQALKDQLSDPYILKAGSRRYKANTYAELVARTRTREAQSQSTINIAANVGSDLVQVDSHNTTTEICIPFEGKIFSISGNDKDFPPLTMEPPFHPNCLHNITIVFREVLERRGIEPYIDFANGKTEIHPTRTSHVPVSERSNVKKQSAPKDYFTDKNTSGFNSMQLKVMNETVREEVGKLNLGNSRLDRSTEKIIRDSILDQFIKILKK